MLSELLRRFLPPGLDPIDQVRARLFVGSCLFLSALVVVFLALYALAPGVPLTHVGFVSLFLIPTVGGPFLLRRWARLRLVSWAFVALLQVALAASAVIDRGTDDVAMIWLALTPLIAALVGGARASAAAVASASVAAGAVLAAAEAGVVFPDLMAPAFSRRYHIVNVVGGATLVAVVAWLYEGPLLSRTRALAGRLRQTNDDLRRELAARQTAQARAEAASRAKDVLLANLSHEFRTPLTAVLCGIQILESESEDADGEVLASMDRGARRLLATLTSVLDLVELESRDAQPLEHVDVAEVVRRSAEAARPRAHAKGLGVAVDADTSAVAAAAAAPLARLVEILVDNAVRFTEEGLVVVRVAPVVGGVEVAVADTGIGMDPAFVERALEPFAQGSEGDTRTHEGLGLGLTIANRLARSMGADLAIDSALGVGTRVRLRLRDVGTARADAPAPGAALSALAAGAVRRAPLPVPVEA